MAKRFAKFGAGALTSRLVCATISKHVARRSAGVAHLVERRLAKAEVAGSSPVSRSTYEMEGTTYPRFITWRHSQAVRQRSAKPSSPVRFRVAPPNSGAKLYRHPKKPVTTGFFVAFHPFADLGSTVYLLPQTSINHKNIIKAPVKENLGRRFCHFPVQSINLHIFSYNRSKYFRKRMASENP